MGGEGARLMEGRGRPLVVGHGRHGTSRKAMEGHGTSRKAMEGHGMPWKATEGHGMPWRATEGRGMPWKIMEGHGRPTRTGLPPVAEGEAPSSESRMERALCEWVEGWGQL